MRCIKPHRPPLSRKDVMWRRSGAGDGSTVAVVASRKWRRLGDGAAEVRRREGSDGGDDGSAAHRLQSIELGGSEVCAGVPAFAVAAGAGGEIQAVMPNARLLLSCAMLSRSGVGNDPHFKY